MYIDASHKVRGVEIDDGMNLSKDQLHEILKKNINLTLTKIPYEKIDGFQLSGKDTVLNTYYKGDVEKEIDFLAIKDFFKTSAMNQSPCHEFYFRCTKYWVAAINMSEYYLI